jgi:hypothetical protein
MEGGVVVCNGWSVSVLSSTMTATMRGARATTGRAGTLSQHTRGEDRAAPHSVTLTRHYTQCGSGGRPPPLTLARCTKVGWDGIVLTHGRREGVKGVAGSERSAGWYRQDAKGPMVNCVAEPK